MNNTVTIVGAGLAGCEAAWQLVRRGIPVRLIDMKPKKYSPAHKSEGFAELVCSNSLKAEHLTNASGLLKSEMKALDGLILSCAEQARVPAGGALAVDRHIFSGLITETLKQHPLVTFESEIITEIPAGPCIIATGPLTDPALTGAIDWTYELPEDVAYVSKQDVGVYASPVVGQESISDLVIFTVSNGREPARVLALDKKSGSLKWETMLEGHTISSPVAVYNAEGDAWLIQAEESGKIHMMNPKTGKILSSLQLTAEDEDAKLALDASPAVYGNLMVIGTTGSKAGGVYCIKID